VDRERRLVCAAEPVNLAHVGLVKRLANVAVLKCKTVIVREKKHFVTSKVFFLASMPPQCYAFLRVTTVLFHAFSSISRMEIDRITRR